ncbi:MAG: N-acetylmuramoyl-L-alanine amidase [Psychrobacillus sp.]
MAKLIALCDGHGMQTAGKRTPILPNGEKSETGNFMHENEFNRAVVKHLNVELKRNGFNTLLVAPTDVDTPLETRTNLANSKKADLYISIHANANTAKWGDWGGIETFCYASSSESKRLATIVHKHVMQGTKFTDRGVKDGSGLWVLRKTNMPAILLELGFMDSNHDYKYLLSDAYRKECAVEIAKGVCEYYKVTYKEEAKTEKKEEAKPVTTDELYRVRKSWADAKSQIGAFAELNSAKKLADANKDYEVYDKNGKAIYPTSSNSGDIYVVVKNDTLWGISQKYNMSVDELKSLNGLKNDTLSVGQKLKVVKHSDSKPTTDKKVTPAPKEASNKLVYTKVLKSGSKGSDVKALQTALNKLKFNCGTPDGDYGAKTKDAVERFQKVYLPYEVDGIAGKNTVNKINSLL